MLNYELKITNYELQINFSEPFLHKPHSTQPLSTKSAPSSEKNKKQPQPPKATAKTPPPINHFSFLVLFLNPENLVNPKNHGLDKNHKNQLNHSKIKAQTGTS